MNEDTVAVMGGVRIGVNVDIKRTNGRIHSAVVSGTNVETKYVTVEWFERGETKCKEIELEQILGLNRDLAPTNYITADVPSKVQKVSYTPVTLTHPALCLIISGHIKGVGRNIVPFLSKMIFIITLQKV